MKIVLKDKVRRYRYDRETERKCYKDEGTTCTTMSKILTTISLPKQYQPDSLHTGKARCPVLRNLNHSVECQPAEG